jgi:hypothetical protein
VDLSSSISKTRMLVRILAIWGWNSGHLPWLTKFQSRPTPDRLHRTAIIEMSQAHRAPRIHKLVLYLRLGGRRCHRFGLLGLLLLDAGLTSLAGSGVPSIDKR